MKALKTLIAIALSAGGLGTAVTLGAIANNNDKNIEIVSAATAVTSVTLKGSFDSWGSGIAFTKDSNNDWNLTHSLSKDVEFKIVVTGGEEKWVGHNWGISSNNVDYDYIGNNGENFKMLSSQSIVFKVKSTFYTNYGGDVTIKKNPATSYTVTKYAVVDNVLQNGNIGTDIVPVTDTYAVPSSIKRAGCHFVGWYTDQACTVSYTAGTLSGNLSLYAKYTSLINNSYIYYLTGSTDTCNDYIYTFGGDDQFGGWPGTKITSAPGVQEVHGVMSFQNTAQNIFKIPYSTASSDNGVIIHNNSGTQTVNMSLVSHSAYWFITDKEQVNYHNDDAGAALDLILAVETKRNAVSAHGNIANYSICGISASDAASLYNTYYAMSADVKAYVNSSKTYTYDGLDTSNQVMVSFQDIMARLRIIALAGNQTVSGGSRNIIAVSNNNSLIIVAVTSTIAITAFGLFFFVRRKRKEQ